MDVALRWERMTSQPMGERCGKNFLFHSAGEILQYSLYSVFGRKRPPGVFPRKPEIIVFVSYQRKRRSAFFWSVLFSLLFLVCILTSCRYDHSVHVEQMVSRFRVKKLSPKHPLPIYKESQLPDIGDAANVQRSVPQIETGVEKEEEEEVLYGYFS